MAEMKQNPYTTSPQPTPNYGEVDKVAAVPQKKETQNKRNKYFVFLLAFIVILAVVLLILGLTVLWVRTPKFQIRSTTFERFDIATVTSNPSFNIRMIAELGVRNTNFGHYSYQSSTIEFYYRRETRVGQAVVPRARAGALSTRRFNVAVDLSSTNVPTEQLSNEFRTHAIIPLTSKSTLRGRVLSRKRSSNLNCTMGINISSRRLSRLSCN